MASIFFSLAGVFTSQKWESSPESIGSSDDCSDQPIAFIIFKPTLKDETTFLYESHAMTTRLTLD